MKKNFVNLMCVVGAMLAISVQASAISAFGINNSEKCEQDRHPDHPGSCQIKMRSPEASLIQVNDSSIDAARENYCNEAISACLELAVREQGQASVQCIRFYRDNEGCDTSKAEKELSDSL